MKTSTERNRDRRKWLKEQGWGRCEVEAPLDKHEEIKKYVARKYPKPRHNSK